MKLSNFFEAAFSSMAILAATANAWAGCNCNVPPAPSMYQSGWNTPMAQGGMPFGASQYGASQYGVPGAFAGQAGYPGAMPGIYGAGVGNAGAMPVGYPNIAGYPTPAGMAAPGMNAGAVTGGVPGATSGPGYGPGYGTAALPYGGMIATNGPHWAPGGYEPRVGSPAYYYDPAGGQYVMTGNPYYDHFGPGFQRNSIYGHYSFPYYSYRRPWYFPGRAVYNRNTNLAW